MILYFIRYNISDIKILMKELNVVSCRFFMEFVAKGTHDNIRTPCV